MRKEIKYPMGTNAKPSNGQKLIDVIRQVWTLDINDKVSLNIHEFSSELGMKIFLYLENTDLGLVNITTIMKLSLDIGTFTWLKNN